VGELAASGDCVEFGLVERDGPDAVLALLV